MRATFELARSLRVWHVTSKLVVRIFPTDLSERDRIAIQSDSKAKVAALNMFERFLCHFLQLLFFGLFLDFRQSCCMARQWQWSISAQLNSR